MCLAHDTSWSKAVVPQWILERNSEEKREKKGRESQSEKQNCLD